MTAPYLILAIVEGHGEQKAVPLLLRRWFQHRRFRNFETRDLAIRAPGAGALKCPYDAAQEHGIEYYVEMAARERPDGILVVLDADDECQERAKDRRRLGLGPELLQRARRIAPHVPIEVVVANREYEAWFLAALDTLRRVGSLPRKKRWEKSLSDIESIRDCKKPLAYLLGRPYEETNHVPLLVRGPGVAAGSTTYKMALNTDHLPTFTHLAGTETPPYVDGRSLRPVLNQSATTWRNAVLLEGPGNDSPTYYGIRTVGSSEQKYVEYVGSGAKEQYYLESDPYELTSKYSSSAASGLASRLQALKSCAQDTCRTAENGQ